MKTFAEFLQARVIYMLFRSRLHGDKTIILIDGKFYIDIDSTEYYCEIELDPTSFVFLQTNDLYPRIQKNKLAFVNFDEMAAYYEP